MSSVKGPLIRLIFDRNSHVPTWTSEVCRIIAFWAVFKSVGPLFYILWGFRYPSPLKVLARTPRVRMMRQSVRP